MTAQGHRTGFVQNLQAHQPVTQMRMPEAKIENGASLHGAVPVEYRGGWFVRVCGSLVKHVKLVNYPWLFTRRTCPSDINLPLSRLIWLATLEWAGIDGQISYAATTSNGPLHLRKPSTELRQVSLFFKFIRQVYWQNNLICFSNAPKEGTEWLPFPNKRKLKEWQKGVTKK